MSILTLGFYFTGNFYERVWIGIYFETRPLITHAIQMQVIFSTGNLDAGDVFFLQDYIQTRDAYTVEEQELLDRVLNRNRLILNSLHKLYVQSEHQVV